MGQAARMTYIESIRGYPYMPKKQLADEFHMGKTAVYTRMKEIEEEIQNGRYSDYAVINDGNIVLVNVLVFIDYMTYRQKLRGKNTRKYVPAFNPAEIARITGWENRPVRIDGE